MRFSTLIVSALAFVASPVHAFSNGTILPSYLCGVNDGLPKTVGGVIKFFESDHITDRGYPVATWHQQPPPNGDPITDPATYNNRDLNDICLQPKANTLLINPTANFNTINLDTGFTGPRTIFPGQEIALDLITRNPDGLINRDILQRPIRKGKGVGEVAQVLGAFVYAQDANGMRVGRFTAFGNPIDGLVRMQPWAACGPNAVGIVHNFVLNETEAAVDPVNPINGAMPIFTGIKWQAPANLKVGTTITFKGVGVTRFGFGPHSTDYQVIAAPIAIPTAPVVTVAFSFGANVAVFFEAQQSNPKTTKFTASVTQNGMTSTFSASSSPILAKISRNAAPATIHVTAMNTIGVSPMSNVKTITPGPQFQVVSALTETSSQQTAQVYKEFAGLCPDKRPDYADADGQCSWTSQASTVDLVFNAAARDNNQTMTPTQTSQNNVNGATQSSSSITMGVGLIVLGLVLTR